MADSAPPFFPLTRTRTHEVCGPGSYAFAFALAAHLNGPVLWLQQGWESTQLNPNGFADFIDPARLILCNTKDQLDTLAAAEEALRSGAAPLVIMALTKPLGLTEGRRLQLAARAGKSTGLAIIPEGMGSNAAETRWHCAPICEERQAPNRAPDSTLQRWELIKNKSGTLGVWHVRWDPASRRLSLVSPARQ